MIEENLEIERIVERVVKVMFRPNRLFQAPDQKEILKATVRRLYAYPDITARLEADAYNTIPERSRSIVGFVRGGRVPPDQKDAILEMEAIASKMRDQTEVEAIASALDAIKDDPYYDAIKARYFRQETDDIVAARIPCDERTIRRNRSRLVRRISIRLYGVDAL